MSGPAARARRAARSTSPETTVILNWKIFLKNWREDSEPAFQRAPAWKVNLFQIRFCSVIVFNIILK